MRRRSGCHEHTVTILDLCEENGWLVSAGYDERCHVWSLPDLELLASVPERLPRCRALATHAPRHGACYLACGTTCDSLLLYKIVAARKHPARGLSVQLLQEHRGLAGSPYRSIRWSPDGSLLLIAGFRGAVHWLRFDPERQRVSRIATPPPTSAATGWGAAFAAGGRRAATIDAEGHLYLWSIERRQPQFLGIHSPAGLKQGRCVGLSADASTVYCGDDDGNVLALREVHGRYETIWLRRVHRDSVYSVRPLHGDRDLLTCGLDARVSLLDGASGLDRVPPFFPELPPQRLAVEGLRVRADALDEQDRRYLARRGVVLVEP